MWTGNWTADITTPTNYMFVHGNKKPEMEGDDGDLKCVVKNTFLELVDSQPLFGARKRSSSDSHVSLKNVYLSRTLLTDINCDKGDKEETWSNSTPSLVNDDGSLHSFDDSRDGSKSPTGINLFGNPEEDQETLVPAEVRETLEKLTQDVGDNHFKREDLENHEATQLLYPHIPLDEEGNITSLGSILHSEGTCKPCAFLKKDRCHKRDLCIYCHLGHDLVAAKPQRFRKSKKKRMRQARQRSAAEEQLLSDQDDFDDDYEYSAGARVSL
jgi:hypothetical protein